ncbi:hypothetical protein BJV82DRAFT_624206 [Fennellomyces sp. T-0311]|nr:hypothetical protein BJV82DRAFT_624206 [Fennellomyces sp. T-0311]
MQSTFASLFSSFQQNADSAHSAQSLNAFLQKVVESSVKIETCLEPSDHGIQLTATITSMFQTPFPNVNCSITFESEGIRWSSLSASQQTLSGQVQGSQSLFEAPGPILPLCQHIEKLQIKTEEPVQCDARIRLEFPGPMPHSTIPIEHAFGIYVIDQLPKSISTEQPSGDAVHYREYPANALRLLMQIPPHQGLTPGLCIALQLSHLQGPKITCRIEGFSDDLTIARIGFYAHSDAVLDILELVVRELDKLNK